MVADLVASSSVGTTTVTGGDCFSFSRVELPAGSEPFKITSGPDGNLWFTEYSADKIAKSTTAGAVTAYDISHWASTPDMSSARFGHSATLLPNGSVLVLGGSNGTSISATAEIYKPSTNTWRARLDASPDPIAFFASRGRPANLSIFAKVQPQKQSELAPKAAMQRKKTRSKDRALLPARWRKRYTRQPD